MSTPIANTAAQILNQEVLTNPADLTSQVTGELPTANIANNAVSNAKLAQMAAHTFKGNNTGSTANAADLTAAQATAELNAMVGDSGSGGTKGLVPAPAAGDAAAGKFLKADGTFAVPSGGGSGTVTNTGTLTSGKAIIGNGSADVTVSSLTANLVASSSGALSGAVASANSKLLGSGASGSAAPYAELTLGTNLSMSGTTLNATGGGNTTSTGAEASIPAAGTSGNLYLPDDGFWLQRDSGSAWVPWGPIFPLTDPALAAPTTWVNQGTATVSSSRGPIVLTNNGGISVALRAKSAPSTPYTITIVCYVTTTAAFGQMQFGFRESTSGKLSGLGVMPSGNVEIQKWNSPTSWNSNYSTFGALLPSTYAKGPIFLQIADDGTTRYYRVSGDNGVTWRVAYSVGRTDFLTADQVYFGVDNESGGTPYTVMTLLSWKET